MHRITSIDSFRGMMLVLMTITHLLRTPFGTINFLIPFFYGSIGFFTDAEGFIFLSGLVAGMVYGRMVLEGREQQAFARIVQRMKQMYLWQTGLLLLIVLFLLFSESFTKNCIAQHEAALKGKDAFLFLVHHPLQAFGLGCSLLYLPALFDLLPMYMLFLAATPFILRQLKAGRALHIACGSIAIWLAAQLIPSKILETALKAYIPAVKLGWFDTFAWQLLFVAGLIIGYLKIEGRLFTPPKSLIALSTCLVVLFFTLKHWGPSFPVAANLYELGIIRIVSFGAIACTVWGFHRYLSFKPLALLGKYPLQVFLYHIAVYYFIMVFQPQINSLALYPKLGVLACCVLTLWIPAYLCEIRKQQRSAAQIKLSKSKAF